MFERPILIYSNYCNYSNLFIEYLSQFPGLFESFIRVNIDVDPNTKQRTKVFYDIQELLQFKIVDVPTIIVQNGEYVLSGKEAFSWLEHQLNELKTQSKTTNENSKNEENQESVLEAFNPLEMGSFSDGYACINDDVPKSQSFQFLNEPTQFIKTPDETGENFDKTPDDYSNFLQKRNNNIENKPYQSPNERINSQSSNNFENANAGKKTNKKHGEMDKKYEDLLAEREIMFQKKTPKKVNFADGTMH